VVEFSLASTGKGALLFQEKGCQNCHQGKLALEKRLAVGTLTDFSLAMWNHAPDMAEASRRSGQPMPKLEAAEMGEIVSFLWSNILYSEAGDAAKGLRVFEKKNCSSCHSASNGSGPDLKQVVKGRTEPIRPFSMISVLWQHGPKMLAQMESKHQPWPVFSQTEMADLVAYLNKLN
jgi:cytochrome c2